VRRPGRRRTRKRTTSRRRGSDPRPTHEATDGLHADDARTEGPACWDRPRASGATPRREAGRTAARNGRRATGRGDADRLRMRGTLRRVRRRGERLEDWAVRTRTKARNAANPRIGCRVQQTCRPRVEQTVEVVRNHEGGRCSEAWTPR
jgi:hypothetical protein